MNVYARFDEIPSITLEDIKKTKRYGRTDRRTDNVKTVYPPTNTVCGGYNKKDRYAQCRPRSDSSCLGPDQDQILSASFLSILLS